MSNRLVLRRRAFIGTIAAVSGGMALGWRVPALAQGQSQAQALGIWVVISPDDTTTIRIARSEMGQGTFTGLAQLFADELDRVGGNTAGGGANAREESLHALTVATTFASWSMLRDELHLDVDAATAVLRRAVTALLQPGTADGTPDAEA